LTIVSPDDSDARWLARHTATSLVVTGGELSDAQLQALWLRRVQTNPADFLRAKFAYQLSRRQQEKPQS
jgi:hypothetical protein